MALPRGHGFHAVGVVVTLGDESTVSPTVNAVRAETPARWLCTWRIRTLTRLVPTSRQSGWWDRIRFAGQRPRLCGSLWITAASPLVKNFTDARPEASCAFHGSPDIRHPSTLIAPVPYARTLAATVPMSGLRATHIGSCAGFSAVPQPSHCAASGVAGAVIDRCRSNAIGS